MPLFSVLVVVALAWAWVSVVVAVVLGRSFRRREDGAAGLERLAAEPQPAVLQLSRSSR